MAMRWTTFTLFLGLLTACGGGLTALALRGAVLPAAAVAPLYQFEFLAVASLLLIWGLMQLALAEDAPPARERPAEPAAARSAESDAPERIAREAARRRRMTLGEEPPTWGGQGGRADSGMRYPWN